MKMKRFQYNVKKLEQVLSKDEFSQLAMSYLKSRTKLNGNMLHGLLPKNVLEHFESRYELRVMTRIKANEQPGKKELDVMKQLFSGKITRGHAIKTLGLRSEYQLTSLMGKIGRWALTEGGL